MALVLRKTRALKFVQLAPTAMLVMKIATRVQMDSCVLWGQRKVQTCRTAVHLAVSVLEGCRQSVQVAPTALWNVEFPKRRHVRNVRPATSVLLALPIMSSTLVLEEVTVTKEVQLPLFVKLASSTTCNTVRALLTANSAQLAEFAMQVVLTEDNLVLKLTTALEELQAPTCRCVPLELGVGYKKARKTSTNASCVRQVTFAIHPAQLQTLFHLVSTPPIPESHTLKLSTYVLQAFIARIQP